MALTLTGNPGINHAAFNAVEWTYTSDRYTASESGQTATVHADSGSQLKVTIAGHGYITGDIVTGAGFSAAALNVKTAITKVDADNFTCDDITWVAAYSTDKGGTWIRTNDNFFLTVQIKKSTTVRATKYVEGNTDSNFIFDISKQLQTILGVDGGGKAEVLLSAATTAITTGNDGCALKYTLYITENYDDVDGVTQVGDNLTQSTLSGSDIICYNIALQGSESITDYNMTSVAAKAFLTPFPRAEKVQEGARLQLAFITSETAVYATVVQTITGGGTNDFRIPSSGTVTVTDRHCILPIPTTYLSASINYITVKIYNATPTLISESLVIYVNHDDICKPTELLFKTHLGGFDNYTFIEREEVNKDKTDRYEVEGVEKTFKVDQSTLWTLEGRYENSTIMTWLRDLYNSDSIYEVDGSDLNQVNRVAGSNIIYRPEISKPKIKVNIQPLDLNN